MHLVQFNKIGNYPASNIVDCVYLNNFLKYSKLEDINGLYSSLIKNRKQILTYYT